MLFRSDDYRVVFERKCLFEINLIDPEVLQRVGHEISEPEELIVKILVKVSLKKLIFQGPEQDYTEVKVELFSQSDYFFLYHHTCDIFTFSELKEQQNLKPDFTDYLTMLIKLFNCVIS